MSSAFNGGNNFNYQPFTDSSKGNGYLPYGDALNAAQMGGAIDTTNDPMSSNNGDAKWTEWFGAPPYSSFQRDNYSQLGHENYQLPTAYIGRNLHIEKLLNVSIASQDDFYTRVLLPWRQFDGMKITFSKWSGFDHMMAQVPEEVPAPQIQTRFEQGEAYQQRYGLAFKMEHGFQRTEMGRRAYTMNLAIITQAVLRTVYARVMQVLVSNRNWLSVLAAKNFPSAAVQAREVSKASVHSFGCIQKNTDGLNLLINNIMRLFDDRMLAPPDAIVIPHGVLAYISTCKPETRVYALCGSIAERLGLKTEREMVANVFKNNFQIFEHKPMNVSNDTSNEVNMLARDREVGNYFRLFRTTSSTPAVRAGMDPLDSETSIKIIDHDRQRWVTITLGEALKHSQAFKDDGTVNENGPLGQLLDVQTNTVTIGGSLTGKSTSNELTFADLGTFLTPETLLAAELSIEAALRRSGDMIDKGTANIANLLTAKGIKFAGSATVTGGTSPATPTPSASVTSLKTALRLDKVNVGDIDVEKSKNVLAASGLINIGDTTLSLEPETEILANQKFLLILRPGEDLLFFSTDKVNGKYRLKRINPDAERIIEDLSPNINAVSAAMDDFSSGIANGDEHMAKNIRLVIGAFMDTPRFSKYQEKLRAYESATGSEKDRASASLSKAFAADAKKSWKEASRLIKQDPVSALERIFEYNRDVSVQKKSDRARSASGVDPRVESWLAAQAQIGARVLGSVTASQSTSASATGPVYLNILLTLDNIVALDKLGIQTPFGAFVFRPCQSFSMGSAVVMKSGNDTGFTCVGNSDFQLGDSVVNKTHLGHFSFYFEPVVVEPNHVMIARDVAFLGYNGGAGAKWFNDWADVGTDTVMGAGVRPSLLASVAFAHEGHDDNIMDPMSISGMFSEGSILCNLESTQTNNNDITVTPHYMTSAWYSKRMSESISVTPLDDDTSSATEGHFHGTGTNFICYQGLQCSRDADGKWETFVQNTGHLGDSESTDSSMAWSGHLAFKTSVNYHVKGNSLSLLSKST